MLCPSCSAEHGLEQCAETIASNALISSLQQSDTERTKLEDYSLEMAGSPQENTPVSRLIEFPGVTRRNVPEWRKELSERVREVQERRAREAAAEAEESVPDQPESPPTSLPQLELLPQSEVPEVNPVVAAALRRIERARQSTAQPTYSRAATAVAVAPEKQEEIDFAAEDLIDPAMETPMSSESAPIPERTHNLVVVQAPVAVPSEPVPVKPKPKRMIADDDPALSYLDSIGAAYGPANPEDRAPLSRRVVGAVLDGITVGFLALPVAAVIELQDGNWHQPKIIGLMAGIVAVVMFVYATVSTALTGRTLGMRMLSLRAVDVRTGLIPTGNQSAGRALVYLLSLATLGIGLLFAFARGEGKTVHDRLTSTAVLQD
jgi:uncharacterized RDD family membrane protein YckC